ncbi:hypothetical protein LCER1_G005241 [Lachnellula cervina]|uniref:Uncharacterized protein n=1 Tax=Lachnellula cervina TaxID=1316786 RepID=A0A7D8UYI6_9HELO|nr:hypothetical protein LCER1_G005241 [Lachnellula cervina]
MEDAAFKAMYERGYRTWCSLWEKTAAEPQGEVSWGDYLCQLETAFPCHPAFPEDLSVDISISNVAFVTGTSTWGPMQGSCDLPSFDQEFLTFVATNRPTLLSVSEESPRWFGEEDDHIAVLFLAWTYILSARWAEIIPGAIGPEYNSNEAIWTDSNFSLDKRSNTSIIDLGDVDDDAARWWAAVLAVDGGWNTSIPRDDGPTLHSLWHTKIVSQPLILTRSTKSHHNPTQHRPPASFTVALRYLTDYCEHHQVFEQSHAALAASLLLPAARYDNAKVQISTPRFRQKSESHKTSRKTLAWTHNLDQLDRLLALSCNPVGTKALLTSIFFEPGVECNICGAWLEGTFAFLDSDTMKDQQLLLRVLMKRDPALGFLWLGAFIIGGQARSLGQGRAAWWNIDLNTAAWTGTLMSFIQEPISAIPSEAGEISRADEMRLLYLCHDQPYTGPPLFPWAPFGSTALTDTNLDVRVHAQCNTSHGLEYKTLTWRCRDGKRTTTAIPHLPYRAKNGNPTNTNISVDYDKLNQEEDDNSESITRNVFVWLREDGFPVAERDIREHEWIDNLDDDDDGGPITGDALSTVGGNLHGWLMKTITTRCNSL